MRIWRLTSPYDGWDIYLAAVVAAPDEETARLMHPDGESTWDGASKRWNTPRPRADRVVMGAKGGWKVKTYFNVWAAPDEISAEEIGVTYDDEQRVILSSYNAA